jgi:hypothetical protein
VALLTMSFILPSCQPILLPQHMDTLCCQLACHRELEL